MVAAPRDTPEKDPPAPLFGLRVSNIPLWNLRLEFQHHRDLLRHPEFRAAFDPHSKLPIQTKYLYWNGMPDEFLTLILQRAIVGVEAYLPYAVFSSAARRGRFRDEDLSKIHNPSSLPGRSPNARKYFAILPRMVDDSCALDVANPALYAETLRFYKEIRNPLFHGNQLSDDDGANGTYLAFEFISRIYEWIDGWAPEVLEGTPRRTAPTGKAVRISLTPFNKRGRDGTIEE